MDDVICECENVTLTCEAYGIGYEVTMLHFYHNGQLIKQGSPSGVYAIDNIRPEDQGIYTCIPESELGVGLNKTLRIIVEPGKRGYGQAVF